MSGDAMGFAIRHAPFSGTTYTVYLCLADAANDLHGHQLWFAMGNLALKARCSRRSAQLAMQEIVDAGLIETVKAPFDEDGKPTGRPGLYRFLFPDGLPVIYDNRGAQISRTQVKSSVSRCADSSQGVRGDLAGGVQPPRTNPIEPKNNHSAASPKTKGKPFPETEALEQTAAAQRQILERNNGRIFGDRKDPEPVADGLAWIEKIRAERAGVRK